MWLDPLAEAEKAIRQGDFPEVRLREMCWRAHNPVNIYDLGFTPDPDLVREVEKRIKTKP
jgi:hypothetical protein